MLSVKFSHFPEPVAKAFNHWPAISNDLRDLFNRGPVEAVVDTSAALARLAFSTVEENDYPIDLAQKIRDEAQAILARNAEANRERVAAAIAEPMRLLKSIDDFIVLVQQPGNALSRADAEAQARKFLEWCGQLDRALSAIPVRLREGVADDR